MRILAITGSYRHGGIIESTVEAVLAGARERGAETAMIRLGEQPLEFCSHCRACTQEPGIGRGICARKDGLEAILKQVDAAEALVLGSPVSFYNVTAVYRRFLERLMGCAYWPWGQASPAVRFRGPWKKAVLVASSAAPGPLMAFATGAPRALRLTARLLGFKPVGKLWLGLVGKGAVEAPSARTLARARALGRRLAA